MRTLRFDIYFGYRDEQGPVDCNKIYFDPKVHTLEDLFDSFIECVDEMVDQLSEDDEDATN